MLSPAACFFMYLLLSKEMLSLQTQEVILRALLASTLNPCFRMLHLETDSRWGIENSSWSILTLRLTLT